MPIKLLWTKCAYHRSSLYKLLQCVWLLNPIGSPVVYRFVASTPQLSTCLLLQRSFVHRWRRKSEPGHVRTQVDRQAGSLVLGLREILVNLTNKHADLTNQKRD